MKVNKFLNALSAKKKGLVDENDPDSEEQAKAVAEEKDEEETDDTDEEQTEDADDEDEPGNEKVEEEADEDEPNNEKVEEEADDTTDTDSDNDSDEDEKDETKAEDENEEDDPKAEVEDDEEKKELKKQVAALKAQLSVKAEEHKPLKTIKGMSKILGGQHTADYLFGQKNSAYKRGNFFTEIVATGTVKDRISGAEMSAFRNEFQKAASALKTRANFLGQHGLMGALNYSEMIKGEGASVIDYSTMNSQLGEFVAHRTDLIIAYYRSLPSVAELFPVISGIQNKEEAPALQIGGLSQGYREGRIFKGGVKVAAKIYEVADVMFKFKFSNMKELEKTYLNYLNREGSSAIKWTFIEWILVHFGEILLNEQNERRISGVHVPAQAVNSNPANFAADGVLRAIEKAEENYEILPFEIGGYTADTILDVIEKMYDKTTEVVPNVQNFKVYVNARHKRWYLKAYRAKYGNDADFTGAQATIVDLAPESIVWVPNMPQNCTKVFIAEPDSIVLLENEAGEITNFEFTPEFEGPAVMSVWKEGAIALKSGVSFDTKDELVADNYEHQFIFTNDPKTAFDGSLKTALVYILSADANLENVPAREGQVLKLIADADVTVSGLKDGDKTLSKGQYIRIYPELKDENTVIDGQTVTVTVTTGKYIVLSEGEE